VVLSTPAKPIRRTFPWIKQIPDDLGSGRRPIQPPALNNPVRTGAMGENIPTVTWRHRAGVGAHAYYALLPEIACASQSNAIAGLERGGQ
jgi:hypothetical protein